MTLPALVRSRALGRGPAAGAPVLGISGGAEVAGSDLVDRPGRSSARPHCRCAAGATSCSYDYSGWGSVPDWLAGCGAIAILIFARAAARSARRTNEQQAVQLAHLEEVMNDGLLQVSAPFAILQ